MQPRTPRSYALAVPVHPLLGERGQGKIFWTAGAPSAEAANTVHRKAHGLVARRRFRGGGRVVIRRRACREPDRPRRCRPPRRNGRRVAQPTPSEPQIRLVARIMKSPEAAGGAPELIRGSSRAGSPTWQRHLVGTVCAFDLAERRS